MARVHRVREEKSGQAQLRHAGRRQPRPPDRRDVQVLGQGRHDARALSRRRPGAERRARRPGAGAVRQPALLAAAHPGRQAARARRRERKARRQPARRADLRRDRPSAGQRSVVVRPGRPGALSRRRSSSACTPRWSRRSSSRRCRSASRRPRRLPVGNSPEAFRKVVADALENTRKVVREANLKFE